MCETYVLQLYFIWWFLLRDILFLSPGALGLLLYEQVFNTGRCMDPRGEVSHAWVQHVGTVALVAQAQIGPCQLAISWLGGSGWPGRYSQVFHGWVFPVEAPSWSFDPSIIIR
jgi:hypothetical protein